MEIIRILFNNLLGAIRRNPLTFVLMVALLVAAPWLFGVFAVVLIVPLLIGLVSWISIMWRVRDAQRRMERDFAEAQSRGGGGAARGGRRRSRQEGEVTIVANQPARKRVNDDVGEYVDFKEVRDDK